MKFTLPFILVSLLLSGCNQSISKDKSAENLASQIQEIKDKYRPGLGEYMIGSQLHHSKLWVAGINGNWKLADYEVGEIKESIENIKQVETDRPEVKTINMIDAPLDSLASAITQKDVGAFKKQFTLLTSTCNNCHTINKFEFNVITVPSAPPVSNQDFMPHP